VTKEEILAMKPGQEMDDMIIQYIFDGKWPSIKPSESIADAWKVVRRFWMVNLMNLDGGTQWVFTISNSDDAEIRWAMGETAPEAICKAALIAKLCS
jgi:hypothetical protein